MENKRYYIGGSSIAAVLGLSNYKTQLQLWTELTGIAEPEDISDKMQVRLGVKMEQIVSEIFMEDTGKKLHRVNEEFKHDKYDFLVGHIDRRVVGEGAIVEIKTTSAYNKKQWENGQAPQEYLIQLMWYLGLTKSNIGYLVGLIGNTELAVVPVAFDKELFETMVKKAVHFWENFVLTKTMPTTITADDGDTLYKIFPIADPNSDLVLGDDAASLLEKLEASQAELNALENDIDKYKNELKAMLGEAQGAQCGPYRITWKNQSTKRLDTTLLKEQKPDIYTEFLKESKSRVFRFNRKEIK